MLTPFRRRAGKSNTQSDFDLHESGINTRSEFSYGKYMKMFTKKSHLALVPPDMTCTRTCAGNGGSGSLTLESVAGALFAVFVCFVDCCCFVFLEAQLSINWERMSICVSSSSTSSSAPPSSWSWASFACIVCPTVVDLGVGVVKWVWIHAREREN